MRIITRGGHDWTHRFPTIAAAARDLGVATAILDGEAVVLNGEAAPILALCNARSVGEAANGRRQKPYSSPSI